MGSELTLKCNKGSNNLWFHEPIGIDHPQSTPIHIGEEFKIDDVNFNISRKYFCLESYPDNKAKSLAVAVVKVKCENYK